MLAAVLARVSAWIALRTKAIGWAEFAIPNTWMVQVVRSLVSPQSITVCDATLSSKMAS